jgi:hypothetical protein
MVGDAVLALRRHEGGQLLRQFDLAEDEVGGSVGVRFSEGENEQPVWASMQSGPGKRWPQHVSAQPFKAFCVALPDDDGRSSGLHWIVIPAEAKRIVKVLGADHPFGAFAAKGQFEVQGTDPLGG